LVEKLAGEGLHAAASVAGKGLLAIVGVMRH
jgi:hypothetical protein